MFEAIEQARVEAIGARRMKGVAANLSARIENRYERSRYGQMTERTEAPLPDALALLVRERLTGARAPAKARAIVNVWRPWIEERARPLLDRMPELMADQASFGKLARDLLVALNLADQLDTSSDENSEGKEGEPDKNMSAEDEDADGRQQSQATADQERAEESEKATTSDDDENTGSDQLDRDGDNYEAPQRPEAWRPNVSVLDDPEAYGYTVYTKAFDEIVNAEDLCAVDELVRLRAFLDQQLLPCMARSPASPTGCSAG